jgi:anaerobic magnesium-protoporphyrin IX monomethyl ester cyclase
MLPAMTNERGRPNVLLIDNVDLPINTAYKFPHASPPLGVQYLAAYLKHVLRDELGQVRTLSLPLALLERRDPLQAALDVLRESPYDVVGVRSLTSGRDFLDLVTRGIKEAFPDTPIIVGGPYASDSPALILKDHAAVDFTCSNEGEEVLRQFLEARLFGRGDVEQIRGLGFRRDGVPVVNSAMPWIEDIDQIPFPDYTDVDLDRFVGVENPMRIPNGERWAPLFTQRGCPYKCTYCHEGFGKLSRERSVENVIDEIMWLYHEQGVTHFAVLDDIFNVRKERAKEIMRRVIKSRAKVRFSFPNALRGDIMDRELVDLLVEAGTVCIHYAVESASPRIQKWIKKNLRLERLNAIIDYTSQYDVLLRGFYMVGFPDETEDELKATIDHAIASRFTETYFSILCMWPGTKIFDAAVQEGLVADTDWTSSTSHDAKNNGFRYPVELLMSERLRGYGYTHFSTDRLRRNLRIFDALGVPRGKVIEKEVKYAQLLRDGAPGGGPSPYVPELAVYDTLLQVDQQRLSLTDAYSAIERYLAKQPVSTYRPRDPDAVGAADEDASLHGLPVAKKFTLRVVTE